MKKAGPVLAVLAAAFLLFSGCEKKYSAPRPGETEGAGTPEKITIYFIPKNMGNPYFDALSSGFYNAIAQLGEDDFRYVYTGPDTAGAASQIPYVEEALQNGADAVFIAANSNDALNGVFDRAREQGLRIYIINQDIPGSESHRDAAIMPVDFNTIGASLMDLMGSQMGYEGRFAILSATVDAPDQNTWIELMKTEFESNPEYSRMELVEVVYGDDNYEKSAAEAEALLNRRPDLKGIIAPTAVGLPAVCKVVRDRGLGGKVKVTGLGLPSEMAEFIQDGTSEGFQLWNPPYEGYIAVYLVWAEKRMGFVPAPGATFQAGRLGDHTILPNGQILTLERPMLYDRSNIREYAVLF
ncbi:MAG: rhamnose ABC transporter substrate-binding protein [Treponema sp.]|jgi:rhamnose transport system substrate-binding protein|nr:rhamnose ABC transporter substrate-binding protein [Treponema sp.]